MVTELIEDGEFDEMMPDSCKKLSPKEALAEFLGLNKVVIFEATQDKETETLKANLK